MLFLPGIWGILSLIGIILAVLLFPIRILWKMTLGRKRMNVRLDHFAVRLRETFKEVMLKRPLLGPPALTFKFQDQQVRLIVKSARRIYMKVGVHPSVPVPVVVRSARWIRIASVMEGWEVLESVPTCDPMLDKDIELYANGIFAGYLRDKIVGETPLDGPATPLAESLLVIRSTAGLRKFFLRFSPDKGVLMDLKLRTEDIFYRAEDLESLLHHIHKVHDFIVNYERPLMPAPKKKPTKKKDDDASDESDA